MCNVQCFNQAHIQNHVELHGREVGILHCLFKLKRIMSGVCMSYEL